ncbi:hypothetical protein KC353_g54 [Hortaea werneckii]|nr:hypothetical protein KC353_g54 [Hortaea werneckii]
MHRILVVRWIGSLFSSSVEPVRMMTTVLSAPGKLLQGPTACGDFPNKLRSDAALTSAYLVEPRSMVAKKKTAAATATARTMRRNLCGQICRTLLLRIKEHGQPQKWGRGDHSRTWQVSHLLYLYSTIQEHGAAVVRTTLPESFREGPQVERMRSHVRYVRAECTVLGSRLSSKTLPPFARIGSIILINTATEQPLSETHRSILRSLCQSQQKPTETRKVRHLAKLLLLQRKAARMQIRLRAM